MWLNCDTLLKFIRSPSLISFNDVKVQLGHSSISMTVDVYGHLVPGANRAAMDRLPTVEDPVEEAVITFSVVVCDWIREKQRVALEMVESTTEGDRLGLNRQEGTSNTSVERQKSWKARLAKEWLIFLPLFLVTAVVLTLSFGEDYFEALFFDRVSDAVVAWLVTLAPYLLVQLIRSIIWAIRTLLRF